MNGYSFTIITGGHRNDLLENLIKSVQGMNIPQYEIIVCGNYHNREDIRYIHKPELAANAEVCKMRNINCQAANYDNIIVLDDDVLFTENWYENIKGFQNFDMTGCRGIDPEGERWFDYNKANRQKPLEETELIPYNEYNDSVYISGYFMMFKQYVWKKVKFDENRKNYQHDDVDFCHRVIDAGFKISVFPGATVIHLVDGRGREASEKAQEEFYEKHTPLEERLYWKGLEAIREENFTEAVKLLKDAISIKNGVRENYNLALAYQNIGRLKEAESHYSIALELNNKKGSEEINIASLHLHLGEIHLELNEKAQAKKELEKVLKLIPTHNKAQLLLKTLS